MDTLNRHASPTKAFPFVPWISPAQDSRGPEQERSRRLVRSHAARRRISYLDNAFNIPIKDAPHGSQHPFRDVSSSAAYLPAVHSLYQDREVPENDSEENAQPGQVSTGTQHGGTVGPPDLGHIAMKRMDPFRTSPLSNLPDDILEECLQYSVSVLWPNLIPGSRENTALQAWSHFYIVEEAACFALSLGALAHKQSNSLKGHDAQRSQMLKRRLLYVEMESARAVNQALESPGRPITDSLILSALCMANNSSGGPITPSQRMLPFRAPLRELQWLNIYAMNTSNVAHQAGLYHLIQLRGGLNSIELPGLAAILSYSDILAASKSLSRPRFPFFSLRGNRTSTMLDLVPLGTESAHIENRQLGLSPELSQFFDAVRSYIHILEAIEKRRIPLDLSEIADQRNFIQHSALCLPPAIDIAGPYPGGLLLYDAYRIAALIFCLGVVFPLPYETSPLPVLAEMLKQELEKILKIPWPPLESRRENEVLLWAVVMGGIAAAGTRNRPWFAAQIRDLARKNGVRGWSEIAAIIERMLWLGSACDHAGRELWDEAGGLHFNRDPRS